MEQFRKLGLSAEVLSVLKLAGFTKPTEIQERTIPLAIAGKDIVGSSATGSGKTLAFASSIIENLKPNRTVQALVLTPTRELAEQVAKSIANFAKNKKMNVIAVYGGVDIQRQMREIRSTDILVGTPGRILDHINRRTLNLGNVKFLVLDEVDRMLDMGFHKDVESIIRECPEKRQTMLFSATISPEIDYLVKKYTTNATDVSVENLVDASKLKQIYYNVMSNNKFSLLVHLLKKENSELVMVFCSTRMNADFVSENLVNFGIKARAIHGGLLQNKRLNILKEFHEKKFNVLVCTDVAARGLDIKGVTHIYNYDLPKTSDEYIHRIGRTARAGESGKVVNLLSNRDYENFSNIQRNEAIVVSVEELPHFENVRIRMDSRRSFSNYGNRGRDRGRGGDEGRGFGRGFTDGRDNREERSEGGREGGRFGRREGSGGRGFRGSRKTPGRSSRNNSQGARRSTHSSYGRGGSRGSFGRR